MSVYHHTQRAPLYWLLLVIGVVQFSVSFSLEPPWVRILLQVTGSLFAVLAVSFKSLTVADMNDSLSVRFGPLPVFGTRLPYANMSDVAAARSSWIDGWGIHYIPGRGMTYNLWGFDCVEIDMNGRTVRVGTDDPEGLTDFLKGRIAAADALSGPSQSSGR